MDISDLMSKAKDTLTVTRAFGEPIERNGVTVIPVAIVTGGGGGGGDDSGGGGGFGARVRPAGVYVIRGDSVRFQPALDVTSLALASIAATVLLRLSAGRRKRRAQRKRA